MTKKKVKESTKPAKENAEIAALTRDVERLQARLDKEDHKAEVLPVRERDPLVIAKQQLTFALMRDNEPAIIRLRAKIRELQQA